MSSTDRPLGLIAGRRPNLLIADGVRLASRPEVELEVNFRREHMPIDTEPEPTMHTRNVRAKARVCAPSYGSLSIATSYAYDQTL